MTLIMDSLEAGKHRGVASQLTRMMGEEFTVEPLDSGDFASHDTPLTLGIERKAWGNLVGSVHDNQLDAQLSRMVDTYDVRVLLIDGMPEVRPDGYVPIFGSKKSFRYGLFLGTQSGWYARGVWPLSVRGIKAVAWTVYHLYNWCAKEEHRDTFQPQIVQDNLRPMTIGERLVYQLPGIGIEKSKEFRSMTPADLHELPLESWQDLLGPKTGQKAYETWHGKSR